MLVTRISPEVRNYVEAYIWKLTSLLVVKLKLKPAAFSDACNHTHFSAMQADTSKKVKVTWLLRCKHHIVKASTQAGQF